MPQGDHIDFSGATISASNLNLKSTLDNVTQTIAALPAKASDQTDLKVTLQRLQELLTNASELNDEDKVEALKKVQEIAEAAQDPAAGQGIAKTALRFFKGLAVDYENAKQLAGELMDLAKKIAAFFKV